MTADTAIVTALDLARSLRDRLPAAVCDHITEAACTGDIAKTLTRLAAAINHHGVTPTPDERRRLETLHHHTNPSARKAPQ